jgi:hypothetical protein
LLAYNLKRAKTQREITAITPRTDLKLPQADLKLAAVELELARAAMELRMMRGVFSM